MPATASQPLHSTRAPTLTDTHIPHPTSQPYLSEALEEVEAEETERKLLNP